MVSEKSIRESATKLVEALYANLQAGRFKEATSKDSTIGNFIVGIHIIEELEELSKLLQKAKER